MFTGTPDSSTKIAIVPRAPRLITLDKKRLPKTDKLK
jgi:hypothetical protein